MKKLGILLLACITALNLWAEEFKIGKLTFKIESPTTVGLIDADWDITKVFLSDTIDYKGNSYTITSIGYQAFKGCSSLTSVRIPNSVTRIGDKAFWGTALYENPANWENGALYIDNCLIRVDEGYAGHFRIKENTRVIADNAFRYCSSLTSMVVASGNSTYDSRDNCNAIIETATNTLIAGCQNTTIPNSVTSIEDNAFSGCTSLTSMTIPNSVTSIGWGAFKGCTSLTSVTIPNSVTSIGYGAFDGCKSLTSVTIPNSVTSIGGGAFEGCSSLTSVNIPNSVTSIGGGGRSMVANR